MAGLSRFQGTTLHGARAHLLKWAIGRECGADRSGGRQNPAFGSAHIPDDDVGFEQPVDSGGSDEAARDMPSIERRRAANRDCCSHRRSKLESSAPQPRRAPIRRRLQKTPTQSGWRPPSGESCEGETYGRNGDHAPVYSTKSWFLLPLIEDTDSHKRFKHMRTAAIIPSSLA